MAVLGDEAITAATVSKGSPVHGVHEVERTALHSPLRTRGAEAAGRRGASRSPTRVRDKSPERPSRARERSYFLAYLRE